MKKLYLLLDEWDNDRNFVGGELEVLCRKYEVEVICNSAVSDLDERIKYHIYKKPSKLYAISSLIRGLIDKDLWNELSNAVHYNSDTHSTLSFRISEAVRFYINADLFRRFMNKQGCFENGVIYYSYWNFWKCYAVTHEMNKYPDSRAISRIHGYELYDEQIPSGYQPFKNIMADKLDKLIFVSETGRDHYFAKFKKIDDARYGLYQLGTVNVMTDDEKALSVSCHHHGEFLLVSCSRIDKIKRVGLIADALSLIDDVKIRWIHFGSGLLEDEVKAGAERLLNDKENISFDFKGFVENNVIHGFYGNHHPDAFINVSSSEGNPVSVMEALSYGIPVIAPAICNFPNMIQDCGILVSGECRADELAETIRKFAGMPDEDIVRMRNNARRCWEEKFDADKNNRRFVEEVFDRL